MGDMFKPTKIHTSALDEGEEAPARSKTRVIIRIPKCTCNACSQGLKAREKELHELNTEADRLDVSDEEFNKMSATESKKWERRVDSLNAKYEDLFSGRNKECR
jgi:hypothetical protein